MDAVTVKQGDTIVAADLPIHLESGESGQVSFSYTLGDTLKNETFDLVADHRCEGRDETDSAWS